MTTRQIKSIDSRLVHQHFNLFKMEEYDGWFTGNNEPGVPMYDPSTGRCFDGIIGPDKVNPNAGAESTIEALYALLEVEQYPAARRWMFAKGNEPIRYEKDGKTYLYRLFNNPSETDPISVGLVMDLENEQLHLLHDVSLNQVLASSCSS